MPTNIDASIRANVQLSPLVEKADALLRGVLKTHIDEVTAEWSQARDDRGNTVAELRLSDDIGSVSNRFTQAQLGNTERLEIHLSFLWQDLLKVSSETHLKRFQDHLAEALQED